MMFEGFIIVEIIFTILFLIMSLGYFDFFKFGCNWNGIIGQQCAMAGIVNLVIILLFLFACFWLLAIALRIYDGHRFRKRRYRIKSYLMAISWFLLFVVLIPYLSTKVLTWSNFLTNSL